MIYILAPDTGPIKILTRGHVEREQFKQLVERLNFHGESLEIDEIYSAYYREDDDQVWHECDRHTDYAEPVTIATIKEKD